MKEPLEQLTRSVAAASKAQAQAALNLSDQISKLPTKNDLRKTGSQAILLFLGVTLISLMPMAYFLIQNARHLHH